MKFDWSQAKVKQHEMESIKPMVQAAYQSLESSETAGSEYKGWLHYSETVDSKEIEHIQSIATLVRNNADVMIVIGIGGSYLGAKAVIHALTHSTNILFAGYQLSSDYLAELLEVVSNQSVYLNVISKSGTTTEPAVAFRVLRGALEKKYGRVEASKRIIVTTDANKGALLALSKNMGYTRFVIPDDIGGRYSVMTPVGLFPMAVAGINIQDFMKGVTDATEEFSSFSIENNACCQYAAMRNILRNRGKDIELLVGYEEKLSYIADWWIQLFGESEGKDGKGLFPVKMSNTTDLHSMGQMIQDGRRNIFETVLYVNQPHHEVTIPYDESDVDGLNYIAGKSMEYVNRAAMQGTLEAHLAGGVPHLIIEIEKLTEYTIGYLMYFFMKSCGISGYLLGVNPFNQPGVENYKKNMFRILGK